MLCDADNNQWRQTTSILPTFVMYTQKRLRFRRPLHCRHGTGASFFTSRDKLRTVMKEKKKSESCQTSISAHPAQAPEGKTSGNRGRDHHHSLYSRSPKAGPPSLRTVRES